MSQTTGATAWLELGDGSLVYDVFGTPDAARAYLLIHGYAGDRISWGGLGPALGERHYVAVPDLPSHGETTLEGADVASLWPPLLTLVEALGMAPGRLHVVGLSMGGIVATQLVEALCAAGRPPCSLNLVASAGLGLELNQPVIDAFADGPSVGQLLHLLRRIAVRVPEVPEEDLAIVANRLAARRLGGVSASLYGPHGQNIDIVRALGRLVDVMPVRLAYGLRDEILPWRHALNAPPRVALHLFGDAGHMVHWDAPDELLKVLEG